MRFLIQVFCFLILNYEYVVTDDPFVDHTFTFDAMPLGHSGLLITWKPKVATDSEGTPRIYIFEFDIHIVGNENITNPSIDKENLHCYSSFEQYKIHSLNENTLYEVIIRPRVIGGYYKNETYSIKMRTNLKSKRMPAKPYFTMSPYSGPFMKVMWHPCGREEICHDEESGTHFGISIKELDNMGSRKLSEVKQEELFQNYVVALFWPGIIYEVAVYSVNGELKSNSDPQELFLKPEISIVQYVNIISLPDSSVLISWDPPKQSLDVKSSDIHYLVTFVNPSESKGDNALFISDFLNTPNATHHHEMLDSNQRRIFGLLPEITYTYIIIPYWRNKIGFEYRIEHKLQVYNPDLPIAKPDFNYKSFSLKSQTCWLDFQWLPCGRSFDCENTKPGLECSFQIKPKPKYILDDKDHGYYTVEFHVNLVYHVTAKSSIGNHSSESVSFVFKNCSEIQENKSLREESQN